MFKLIIIATMMAPGILSMNAQDIAPQVWSNATIGVPLQDRWTIFNNASYNMLVSNEFPWRELSLSSAADFRFHKHFSAIGALYAGRIKQSGTLSNREVRPFVGFRVNSNPEERLVVTNLSRQEFRWLIYSDNNNLTGWRFRNRTLLTYALNKKSALENKSLNLFAFVEFYKNFNDKLKERFVNDIKYKLGLSFRFSDSWRFDFGAIYQVARTNLDEPVQLPTVLTTNYIFEWGMIFFTGRK